MLVTDNVQSVFKQCMVPDFMKFVNIKLMFEDLDLCITRTNVMEMHANNFRNIIREFAHSFLEYLVQNRK